MAGLLDALNSRDGIFALGLLDAAAPRPVRTSLGGGLLQALGRAQAWQQNADDRATAAEERKQRAAMQAMQQQLMQAQIAQGQAQAAEQARARAQADADAKALRRQFGELPGPTPDGAVLMPRMDVGGMLGQGASLQAVQQAMALQQAMQKPTQPNVKLSPGEQMFSPDGRPLFGVPAAPDKPPAPSDLARLLAEMQQLPPGSPARKLYEQQIAKITSHQPATQVSVNTGQKGFDNTLKLRGDFRSEPIYKAHQEMQSAYSQIQQSLKQASPAGDLAGATKIMKLLDPGSVVRESELGMAMAASGLLDRLQNYAGNVINGTKLTPTQRQDFQRLADALYTESVKQYNGKRSEYQGISERNGLSVLDVLGPESKAPTSRIVDFGSLR